VKKKKNIFYGSQTGGFTPGYYPRALSGRKAATTDSLRMVIIHGPSSPDHATQSFGLAEKKKQ